MFSTVVSRYRLLLRSRAGSWVNSGMVQPGNRPGKDNLGYQRSLHALVEIGELLVE